MSVWRIKENYYVIRPEARRLHILDKSLVCDCKGYKRWRHCIHQKMVVDHIERGGEVDIVRVPWSKEAILPFEEISYEGQMLEIQAEMPTLQRDFLP